MDPRYFERRHKAAPHQVWARPNHALRGAVEWLAERNVPKTHVSRIIGTCVTSYNRWNKISVWPTHSRGYALCLLVKALRAEKWPVRAANREPLSVAEYVRDYPGTDFEHQRFCLGLQWLRVVDHLLRDGYTLAELSALTGTTRSAMTYICRAAQWPRFAVGELLLDLYWRSKDGDPTRILPASTEPGRMPDRSTCIIEGVPHEPFSVLRPVIAAMPNSTRLVDVEPDL